jgi:hypothetical protein
MTAGSPAITFLKPLSAAISIGTGAPLAEGPSLLRAAHLVLFTEPCVFIFQRKKNERAEVPAQEWPLFSEPWLIFMLAIELIVQFSPRSISVATVITGAGMHILFVIVFFNAPYPPFQDLPC